MFPDRTDDDEARRGPAIVVEMAARVVFLSLLWLAITGLDVAALPFGALAVTLAAAAGAYLRPPDGRIFAPVATLRFLGALTAGVVRASLDVGRRAFLPRGHAVAPAFVTYRLQTPTPANALGLSYAMTLMPGTAGAAIEAEQIALHVLDHRSGARGVETLERALAEATAGGLRHPN